MDHLITQTTFESLEDESLYSQRASRASQLPLPGSDEARAMTVGSGHQLSMLLSSSSLLGAFSKILLESSAWTNSKECCYVWDRLDTKFELSAFQLRRLEPDIFAIACSLLPTPSGSEASGGGTRSDRRAQGHHERLRDVVLSPTPRAEGFDAGSHRGNPDSLHATVKLSATPTVNGNHNRKGTSSESGDGISTQAKLTAAPSARDWKNGQASLNTVERNSRPLNEQVTSSTASEASGTLSPRFVEEYQGFPIDHTALKPLAMQSFHSKSRRSSKRSRKSKGT
jgi:hypothetical protein